LTFSGPENAKKRSAVPSWSPTAKVQQLYQTLLGAAKLVQKRSKRRFCTVFHVSTAPSHGTVTLVAVAQSCPRGTARPFLTFSGPENAKKRSAVPSWSPTAKVQQLYQTLLGAAKLVQKRSKQRSRVIYHVYTTPSNSTVKCSKLPKAHAHAIFELFST